MDLKEEDILGDSLPKHWYYKSKANALSHFIKGHTPKHILDIGAGSGFFSKHLLKSTPALKATCVDIGYTHDWQEKVHDKTIDFVKETKFAEHNMLLFMDVLEHVDDDVGLINQYIDNAAQDAYFVFTVPAFQFLWSPHDVFLEHKRRYTIQQLEDSIAKADLELIDSCYYFSSVFPLALGTRLASRLKNKLSKSEAKTSLQRHSKAVNFVLSKLCQLETPFMNRNKIAGLSVFAIAQKK